MSFRIGKSEIGEKKPVFIIAELSANHGGDIEIALNTLKAMKDAGADAVKLQTYTADTLTIDSNKEDFKIHHGTIWDGITLYKLYQEAYTPWEWQPKLKQAADDLGLECFSSPFDKSAVDFLEKMNVPAYKIASFEITDIPLIEYTASKGKPIIISTGIAEVKDIEEALETCRRASNNEIALLKCTSSYPAPMEEINLNTIPDMKSRFRVEIGLSDHTLGFTISAAAVALGATIIEKHFILDKSIGGPDASFSLTPDEFKLMVNSVRDTEKALGKISYELSEKTKSSRAFSRSLFIVKDVKEGEIFSEENVKSIRPGFGMHPRHLKEILGKRAKCNIEKGTRFNWDLVNE
ncbi:MAG: pseudaminic acid synthase [Melioribacteraceae bacterium]